MSGKVITGLIVEETPDVVKVIENPLAKAEPRRAQEVATSTSAQKSPNSIMPKGLLDKLTREEILDLVAYVAAGGDPKSPLFAKATSTRMRPGPPGALRDSPPDAGSRLFRRSRVCPLSEHRRPSPSEPRLGVPTLNGGIDSEFRIGSLKRSPFFGSSWAPELLEEGLVKSALHDAWVDAQPPAGCRVVVARSIVGHGIVPAEQLVCRDLDVSDLVEQLLDGPEPTDVVSSGRGGTVAPPDHDVADALAEFPEIPVPGIAAAEFAIDPVNHFRGQRLNLHVRPIRPRMIIDRADPVLRFPVEGFPDNVTDQIGQVAGPIGQLLGE